MHEGNGSRFRGIPLHLLLKEFHRGLEEFHKLRIHRFHINETRDNRMRNIGLRIAVIVFLPQVTSRAVMPDMNPVNHFVAAYSPLLSLIKGTRKLREDATQLFLMGQH